MIITETWTKDNDKFARIKERCLNEKNMQVIAKHRPGRKVGGGAAIFYKPGRIKLKKYELSNRNIEVVAASGKIPKLGRPVFIFGVYVSTGLGVPEVKTLMEEISDEILKIRTRESEPIFIIGGDFNRHSLNGIVKEC